MLVRVFIMNIDRAYHENKAKDLMSIGNYSNAKLHFRMALKRPFRTGNMNSTEIMKKMNECNQAIIKRK